jgi:tetratricopeptide (TPR) repeat protein
MGTFLPTISLAEIHHARGDADRAVELLDACIAEHPGFFGLVLPFAAALLAQGVGPEAVVERVQSRVAQLTPTVRFMLATALYERGETEAAERQYRALLDAQPANGAARVALAESLLSQRRYADAAQTAAALADDEPYAAAARRTELFARLVGGELDAVHALLERATAAGLPAGEQALYAAWLRAAAGDVTTLPFDAVAPLAVALEALLRVQEVDAFATLVPLLDRTPIAPREQRELRARMYLRRGFLDSAAEEWLAVCGGDPHDVRGLVGLAQVAAAKGMSDDALEFAREAHTLEPGDANATRLLERLEPLAA